MLRFKNNDYLFLFLKCHVLQASCPLFLLSIFVFMYFCISLFLYFSISLFFHFSIFDFCIFPLSSFSGFEITKVHYLAFCLLPLASCLLPLAYQINVCKKSSQEHNMTTKNKCVFTIDNPFLTKPHFSPPTSQSLMGVGGGEGKEKLHLFLILFAQSLSRTKKNLKHRFWTEVYQVSKETLKKIFILVEPFILGGGA